MATYTECTFKINNDKIIINVEHIKDLTQNRELKVVGLRLGSVTNKNPYLS